MFTSDDILARLKAGESAQDIAQNLADSLNTAIKAYEEDKRREEAEQLAATKKEAEKQAEMESITRQLNEFFRKYYDDPPLDIDEITRFSKDIISVFDKTADLFAAFPIGTDSEEKEETDDERLTRFYRENF